MNSRNLELAATFCDLVGRPNLLDYLGLPADSAPDVAQKKLRARRKYMQGMQSNPKYKAEAIFLIKNFSSLSEVLEQPVPYLADARRRSESQHLPVLEMTIKGALTGGTLNHDQEDYLRRNATELGVSEATFEVLLDRLARDAGVPRANAGLRVSEGELKNLDLYDVIGAPRHASHDELFRRYTEHRTSIQQLPSAEQRESERTRLEKAWKVLGDDVARQKYDLSWTRTGPPAVRRSFESPPSAGSAANTLPTLPPRTASSMPPARIVLLTDADLVVQLGDSPISVGIEVRNAGEQPLQGTVSADVPWIRIVEPTLASNKRQQSIRTEVLPELATASSQQGTIQIRLDNGEVTDIRLRAERRRSLPLVPFVAGAVLAAVALIAAGLWFMAGPTDHRLTIEPFATEVLVDGMVIGKGHTLLVSAPNERTATLSVRHPNFKPWVKDISLSPGGSTRVALELSAPMDFRPDKNDKRGKLDSTDANAAMSGLTPQLDACLKAGLIPGRTLQGTLRIHVGANGIANGMEIEGDGSTSPAIVKCLRDQAAGLVFPPLGSGDFATVRYDYVISGR